MISGASISSRFAAIYESLPPDVQHAIIEKQLIPLLDQVNKTKSKRVLASAAKMKRRHADVPIIDLKSKQREVNALLDELHRDAKRSFVRERSHRTELMEQTVESVTCWLNDLWRLVYEYHVDFLLVHRCLLFVVNVLDQIAHGRARCRCAFTSMYVPITLKRKSGKVVKSWELTGAHNIEEVLQFIWRDLFLSLLASGNQRQIKKIPDMLDDIEDLMGWTALERLLYGGRKCPHDMDDVDLDDDFYDSEDESDLDDDDDAGAFTDEDSDLDLPIDHEDWLPKISQRSTPSHARHWSPHISSQMSQFRKLVQVAMLAVFKVSPSLRLYSALISNSSDSHVTQVELMSYLSKTATSSPEVFTAALDIHALENNTDEIGNLLKTHGHLVRPRDAPILQSAVTTMATNPFRQLFALEIIEKELLDTARAVHSALLGPFSLIDTPENRTEIEQIVKLRTAAAGRQDRVERWVDAICTPGMNAPNPMALAAMVMGLPLMPAMEGPDEMELSYLEMDPSDPDLEELREEFRPRLKQRFEGWTDTAVTVKGGSLVLQKVYRDILNSMPFLRANDVVEDMLGRLADKPSKQYLIDAVDALAAFVKVQRRKAAIAKSEQKRRANAAAAQAVAASSAAGSSTVPGGPSASSSARSGASGLASTTPSTAAYAPPTVADAPDGDAADLESRPETPPPPLEPAHDGPAHAHLHPHVHVHHHHHHPHAQGPAPAPLFTFYTGHIHIPQGGGADAGVGAGANLGAAPPGGPAPPGGGGFGAQGGGLFGGAFAEIFGGAFGGGFGGMEDVD
ncbi:hypothetical protein BN946_scf185011.g4 [Trametes cinnabarina]|uniref:Uncharacterized protein n=1 Tax=Pycnoporus cinnabarinus TaxID=5643 RepID=A0A060SPR6_PYCCI|nr:hypothetical protein BN946_scf185011.g4 [Trametes cinnabarina]